MRRITASVLLIFVLLSWAIPAYAYEPVDMYGSATSNDEQSDQGGTFEKIVSSLLEFPIRMVQKIGSTAALQPLDKLVFLSGAGEDEKRIAPWAPGEVTFIKMWYAAMLGLCMPLYVIAIAVSGFKISMSGTKPGMREEAINSIWRWFGATVIVLLAPLLVQTLMWITAIVLDGIQFAFGLVTGAAGVGRNISDWGGINFGGISVNTGSVLGTAIVKVMFVFIWLWFNAIYFVRKLVLTVMICFTPFMALLWALNKNVNAAGIWLGELASNAFMPVAHALVLCVIMGFLDVKNVSNGTWFQILIAIYTIMPLAEVIRNSLQGLITRLSGINEEQTAGKALAAAAGFGGLLSLGRVVGSTMGGGNVAGSALDGNIPTGGGGRLTPVPVGNSRQIGFNSPDILRGNQVSGYSAGQAVSSLPGSGGNGFNASTTGASGSGIAQPPGFTGTASDPSVKGGAIQGAPTTPPGDAFIPQDSYRTPPIGGKAGFNAGRSTVQTAANPGAKDSHPLEGAVRAGSMAGNATRYTAGTLINMAAGAVPGGREISGHINQGMEMATRGLSAAGALGYQTFKESRQTGKGFGETLKEITGADSTLKAVGRSIMLSAKTARSPELGIKQARAYTANTSGGLDGRRFR